MAEKYFCKGKSASALLKDFFKKYFAEASVEQQIEILFNFIKYTERQIVLFDAIEDAEFSKANDLNGDGTLSAVTKRAELKKSFSKFVNKINHFNLRIVLTAHPTQFYPGSVLHIINILTKAIQNGDLIKIQELLQQLGKTPFLKKAKPSPYDEAVSLIWYLEYVFYPAISNILIKLKNKLKEHGSGGCPKSPNRQSANSSRQSETASDCRWRSAECRI